MSGAPVRRLIVNGDDFGQSPGINEGVIRCHEHGILTSTSLMVRGAAAAAAAGYARSAPALSVGLHIDLGEWRYHDGEWTPLYSVAPIDDAAAVHAEVTRQVETFRDLLGTSPTHLDSHQHVHRNEPVARVVAALGAELGVPVRHFAAIAYVGSFYGLDGIGNAIAGALTVDRLIAICEALPAGTAELACHPGLSDDAPGMYVAERALEVAALCDARVRAALDAAAIQLVSFRDV